MKYKLIEYYKDRNEQTGLNMIHLYLFGEKESYTYVCSFSDLNDEILYLLSAAWLTVPAKNVKNFSIGKYKIIQDIDNIIITDKEKKQVKLNFSNVLLARSFLHQLKNSSKSYVIGIIQNLMGCSDDEKKA